MTPELSLSPAQSQFLSWADVAMSAIAAGQEKMLELQRKSINGTSSEVPGIELCEETIKDFFKNNKPVDAWAEGRQENLEYALAQIKDIAATPKK